MYHPLIQKLIDERGYPRVTEENHNEFVGQPGTNVLFFAGDPKQHKESTDVAVILPELVAAFGHRLRPGVVADYPKIGRELQRRYGFNAWPALVFVREGGYLGTITRVQDWADYLGRIAELLASEPSRPPGFKIPIVVSTATH